MDGREIEGLIQALEGDHGRAPLSEADRRMLDYALKLTIRPASITADDLTRLRQAGFDDLAIHDICAITAYYAFVNRIADGLGVEVEGGDPAPPPSKVAAPRGAGGDDAIQGAWLPSAAELGGKPFPDDVLKTMRLVIEGDRYTVTVGEVVDRGDLKVDPASSPREMEITGTEGPNKGRTIPAIYEVDGPAMLICYDLGGKGRPADFSTREGTQLYLVSYRKEAP